MFRLYQKRNIVSYSLPCSLFYGTGKKHFLQAAPAFLLQESRFRLSKNDFFIFCIIIRKIIIISHTILRRYYAVYFTFDRAQHTGHHFPCPCSSVGHRRRAVCSEPFQSPPFDFRRYPSSHEHGIIYHIQKISKTHFQAA